MTGYVKQYHKHICQLSSSVVYNDMYGNPRCEWECSHPKFNESKRNSQCLNDLQKSLQTRFIRALRGKQQLTDKFREQREY